MPVSANSRANAADLSANAPTKSTISPVLGSGIKQAGPLERHHRLGDRDRPSGLDFATIQSGNNGRCCHALPAGDHFTSLSAVPISPARRGGYCKRQAELQRTTPHLQGGQRAAGRPRRRYFRQQRWHRNPFTVAAGLVAFAGSGNTATTASIASASCISEPCRQCRDLRLQRHLHGPERNCDHRFDRHEHPGHQRQHQLHRESGNRQAHSYQRQSNGRCFQHR